LPHAFLVAAVIVGLDRGVQARWSRDIPGYIRKANENWPKVLNE